MINTRPRVLLLVGLIQLGAWQSPSVADETPGPGPLGAGELVKLFDQVPGNAKLAAYDGASYLSTDSGLYRYHGGAGVERIGLTHPQGNVRSVSRVARARDGSGLYVAAGFETGGFLSPWDSALFDLSDPTTPVKTYARSGLDYFAVDEELRAHASSRDFQYVLPPDDGLVQTLPDAGLTLTEVTSSGARILDHNLVAPDGTRLGESVFDAQDREDGQGFNLVALFQDASLSANNGQVFVRRGQGGVEGLSLPSAAHPNTTLDAGAWVTTGDLVLTWREVLFTQPPLEGLIARDHRLHLPAEHFPFEAYQPSDRDLFSGAAQPNSTGNLWSAPLTELYPELREIDFERVTDFVTSEGEMHFVLTGPEGMWLFSAPDPTFIPEPSGGVLAWLALAALASRKRLPRW